MGSVMFSLVVYGLHGWVWLLLVSAPSSGLDGTQDRGEPPHMGQARFGDRCCRCFADCPLRGRRRQTGRHIPRPGRSSSRSWGLARQPIPPAQRATAGR